MSYPALITTEYPLLGNYRYVLKVGEETNHVNIAFYETGELQKSVLTQITGAVLLEQLHNNIPERYIDYKPTDPRTPLYGGDISPRESHARHVALIKDLVNKPDKSSVEARDKNGALTVRIVEITSLCFTTHSS